MTSINKVTGIPIPSMVKMFLNDHKYKPTGAIIMPYRNAIIPAPMPLPLSAPIRCKTTIIGTINMSPRKNPVPPQEPATGLLSYDLLSDCC